MTVEAGRHDAAPWAWAAMSIAGVIGALFASFGIAIPLISHGLVPSAGTADIRLDLALWLLTMGALSVGAVTAASRLAFGTWPAIRTVDLAVPAIGIGIAIGFELTLHEWAEVSFGYYDWDFVGWVGGLSFAVELVAVSSFAASIAPARAALLPGIALVVSSGLVILILVPSLPGLADGIRPESLPLAFTVLSLVVFVVAVVGIEARRTVRRGGMQHGAHT